MQVKLQQVKSDNLAAIGYDRVSQTLRIRFQQGSSYDYRAVPASVYKALMAAESKGQFFQQEIVAKMYRYEKVQKSEVNPAKESHMKNNQQKQAEARKAAAQPAAQQRDTIEATSAKAAAQVTKQEPTPAPVTPAVSKQDATITRLLEGWKSKGVDLSRLSVKDDGKYRLLHVTPEWPTVQVGASGGIVVLELKSYPDAFTASMEGLERYKKQLARNEKKLAANAPAPAAQPAPPKAETPTQKKKRQDAVVEKQLETASA